MGLVDDQVAPLLRTARIAQQSAVAHCQVVRCEHNGALPTGRGGAPMEQPLAALVAGTQVYVQLDGLRAAEPASVS